MNPSTTPRTGPAPTFFSSQIKKEHDDDVLEKLILNSAQGEQSSPAKLAPW